MTSTEKIDAALDSVLRVTGSSSHGHYTGLAPEIIDRLREAMRKIMTDSYIQGSNDAQDAFKPREEHF